MDYIGGEESTTGKISIAVSVILVFFIMLMLRDFLCSKHKVNVFDSQIDKIASTVEKSLFSILTKAKNMK